MPPTDPALASGAEPSRQRPNLPALVRDAIREELTAGGFAPKPRPLLTPDEVAEWLGISRRTVEGLVASGEIPVVRIGTGRRKLPRFAPDAVEAFIRRAASGARGR